MQHLFDLITVLTHKELKVKYKNSLFGYLWSVAHPLAFAVVFFVAFKMVMRIDVPNYALFLISGLFPWQWFSNSVTVAPVLFLTNAQLIKKVRFPRNLIPFTQVLLDMIHFVLAMPVIVLFLFVYDKSPSFTWVVGIPVLLVIQFLVTYGLSLLVASTNLFFRDLERMAAIFISLLFYFTPVIYPESMVPQKYRWTIYLNPLAPVMVSWRNLFLDGTLEPSYIVTAFGYALAICGLGIIVYRRLSWRFAEVL